MGLCVMVFNATFNNISVISWRSVLLVEKTGENHVMYRVRLAWARFERRTSVVIGTDWMEVVDYYAITTTMRCPLIQMDNQQNVQYWHPKLNTNQMDKTTHCKLWSPMIKKTRVSVWATIIYQPICSVLTVTWG